MSSDEKEGCGRGLDKSHGKVQHEPAQLALCDHGGDGVGHLGSRWATRGLPPENGSMKFLAWLGGLSAALLKTGP